MNITTNPDHNALQQGAIVAPRSVLPVAVLPVLVWLCYLCWTHLSCLGIVNVAVWDGL